MHLPAAIGDFTDFFAGIHHSAQRRDAARPEQSVEPELQICSGRLSQPGLLGAPLGCLDPAAERAAQGAGRGGAGYGPSQKLDYELELAVWIGPGNKIGEPIPIGHAGEHVFGLGLVNDWSARDVQGWESAPLGPFLGKSFGSTVSPWVVTAEAVGALPRSAAESGPRATRARCRISGTRPTSARGAFDIALEALLLTETDARAGHAAAPDVGQQRDRPLLDLGAARGAPRERRLQPPSRATSSAPARSRARQSGGFWQPDGTELGTASRTITLPSGETRTFLEDGDEVIFRAHCRTRRVRADRLWRMPRADHRMTDALGWRLKFGVIAPSTNTVVQPEFDAMRPRGVTNHFGRIHIPNDPILGDADFEKLIDTVRRELMAEVDPV